MLLLPASLNISKYKLRILQISTTGLNVISAHLMPKFDTGAMPLFFMVDKNFQDGVCMKLAAILKLFHV